MRWTYVASAPGEARAHPAVTATTSAMVVWGGLGATSRQPLVDGLLYEVRSGAWRNIPQAPLDSRIGPSLAATSLGFVVWGGATPASRHLSVGGAFYRYESRRWLTIEDSRLLSCGTAVAVGDRILLWRDMTDGEGEQLDALVFDPHLEVVHEMAPLPIRPPFAPFVYATDIGAIVGGGYRRQPRSNVEFQRLGAGTMRPAPPGSDDDGDWSDVCARYDATTNTWEPLPAPSVSLAGARVLWIGRFALLVRADGASFVWEPTSGNCTPAGMLPLDARGLATEQGRARVGDGAVILLHGSDALQTWWWTDSPRRWQPIESPMERRRGISVIAVGERVAVWGGVSEHEGHVIRHSDGWLLEA